MRLCKGAALARFAASTFDCIGTHLELEPRKECNLSDYHTYSAAASVIEQLAT